jgi:hypothetical protein
MKIVFCCSTTKNGNHFIHNGLTINFVSHVDHAVDRSVIQVHPDNLIPDDVITWRELISLQEAQKNLIPAHLLYRPSIYNDLYQNFGNDLFIFSAGWGIVRADYKLPKYDVSFSRRSNVPLYAKRRPGEVFNDFNQLVGINEGERIIFIGGGDYILPFCELTMNLPNEKVVIYKNVNAVNRLPYLNIDSFTFLLYDTNLRTNWHYVFAKKLINEQIEI